MSAGPPSKRVQVELELPVALVRDLDELCAREGLSRSEMALRLMAMSLEELRIEAALDSFRAGRITAVAAAEMLRMTTWEFMELAHKRG